MTKILFFEQSEPALKTRAVARAAEQTRALELDSPELGGTLPETTTRKPVSFWGGSMPSSTPRTPHMKYWYH